MREGKRKMLRKRNGESVGKARLNIATSPTHAPWLSIKLDRHTEHIPITAPPTAYLPAARSAIHCPSLITCPPTRLTAYRTLLTNGSPPTYRPPTLSGNFFKLNVAHLQQMTKRGEKARGEEKNVAKTQRRKSGKGKAKYRNNGRVEK